MAIETQNIRVTARMAKQWLETNHGNRNIRKGWVNQLASDMAGGRWTYTGDPIRFDDKGDLIDGQHRLLAIIQSNAPQRLFIMRGLPRDSRQKMDRNARRNVADDLKMYSSVANTHKVSALARILLRWREGNIRNATQQPSDPEVYEFVVENNMTLQQAVAYSTVVTSKLGGSPQAVGAVYHESTLKDTEQALIFWEKVRTGAMLEETDPALLLRGALQRLDKAGKVGSKATVTLELCVRAWNLMKADKKQESITIKPISTIPDANFDLR